MSRPERLDDVFAMILQTQDEATIARAVKAARSVDLKADDISRRAVAMIAAGLDEVRNVPA